MMFTEQGMPLHNRNIRSMNNIQYDNDINKLIYVLLDSAQKCLRCYLFIS